MELLHRLDARRGEVAQVSTFYNRVNHLTPFKPMWATNILTAHAVWKKYAKQVPKHIVASVIDVRTFARRPPENDKHFEVIQHYLSHKL